MKRLYAVLLTLMASPALAGDFSQDTFDAFVDARAGTGDPVYWYSTGTVRAYPSGDILFLMEGYDTARSERISQTKVQQYSRKTYIFREPDTGAVLKTYKGKDVDPIAYPYQFITYELVGDDMETTVVQGAGKGVRTIGPSRGMSVKDIDGTLAYTAPLFLDFPIPGTPARYQAWENYDFFIQPDGAKGERHQLSWARYGDAPAWSGAGPAIMHMVSWRVEAYEDVPAQFRTYIEADAPLWKAPPKDMADIRRLQQAPKADKGFSAKAASGQ
ncbi:MAG: DUF1838 family protein [Pseudomonadota bacterium]